MESRAGKEDGRVKITLVTLVASSMMLAALPALSLAQSQGSVEFGLDGGITLLSTDDDDNLLTIDIPVQSFRVGFLITESFEIEPSLGLVSYSYSGHTHSLMNLNIDAAYNFVSGTGPSIPFVAGGIRLSTVSNSTPGSQLGFGASAGAKIQAGDRLFVRLEFAIDRYLESDELSAEWRFAGLIGISFYTS